MPQTAKPFASISSEKASTITLSGLLALNLTTLRGKTLKLWSHRVQTYQ